MIQLSLLQQAITAIMILSSLHRASAFSIRSKLYSRHHDRQIIKTSFLSLSTKNKNVDSEVKKPDQQNEQDGFIRQMKDWRGSSRSTSEFVTHFIASGGNVTIEEAVLSVIPTEGGTTNHRSKESIERKDAVMEKEKHKILGRLDMNFRNDPSEFPLDQQLNPIDLIAMGSVWFLPAEAPRDPALGLKPVRLEAKNLTSPMVEGDYLRVHHCPRRFPEVHAFDWGKKLDELNQNDDELPGVIVKEDIEKGYIVLNKPPGVPVHPTVDNVLENVAGAIGRGLVATQRSRLEERVDMLYQDNNIIGVDDANQTLTWQRNGNAVKRKRKETPLLYVVAPQRLDRDTSGLFVVATKKIFAGYFAKLLRTKTDALLKASNSTQSNTASIVNLGHIKKKYRCLVCIKPNKRTTESGLPPSIWDEFSRLQSIVERKEIVRHYLEPTKRAPKIYSENFHEDWPECLMKITDVGDAVPVVGSNGADDLCEKVWGAREKKPSDCMAVMQVEVELLTGRTHQIRGQLSALGFSLCGDALYGGAEIIPESEESKMKSFRDGQVDGYMDSGKLALQCCELEFLDPDYVKNKKGNEEAIRSNNVSKFRIQKAWWSPYLEQYESENDTQNSATTSKADLKIAKEMKESETKVDAKYSNDVQLTENIKRIQLSPGSHKYVIIKATRPLEDPDWFVKTASPEECGGPFHADVARTLVSDLNAAGFDTMVMGGGRIDFDSAKNQAHVYGFSYGFGKGDHEFASLLIEREGIAASFDNSDTLY